MKQNLLSHQTGRNQTRRTPAQSTLPTEQIDKLTESCVDVICPDPEFSASNLRGKIIRQIAFSPDEYTREIEPLVIELAKNHAMANVRIFEFARTSMLHSPTITDESSLALMRFGVLRGMMDDLLYTFDGRGKTVVDEARSKLKNPTLTDATLRSRAGMINATIEKLGRYNIFKDKEPEQVQMLFGPANLHQFIGNAVQNLETKWTEIRGRASMKMLASSSVLKNHYFLFKERIKLILLEGDFTFINALNGLPPIRWTRNS